MNAADIMIHMHQELDAQARTELERKLSGRVGVDCAEFIRSPNPHSLMVRYDPDALAGMEILQMVRKLDPVASMVGL